MSRHELQYDSRSGSMHGFWQVQEVRAQPTAVVLQSGVMIASRHAPECSSLTTVTSKGNEGSRTLHAGAGSHLLLIGEERRRHVGAEPGELCVRQRAGLRGRTGMDVR